MINEIWKDIEGYEGRYQVSNTGKVWSFKHNKQLKNGFTSDGYHTIKIFKGGRNDKGKTMRVHRLVAMNFIANIENKEQVNHIDEDKTNNNVNNLEWCTPKENSNHGTRTSRRKETLKTSENWRKGMAKQHIAVVGLYVKTGKTIELPYMSALNDSGFNSSCIGRCLKGERKTHKGYKWYKAEHYNKQAQ